MKKALLFFAFVAVSCSIFAQDWYDINFDNPYYLDRVFADTVSNPNCSWQVGQPDKTWFTEAWSQPNALVTDLNNPVSPGDTSRFYLWHLRDNQKTIFDYNFKFTFRTRMTQIQRICTDFLSVQCKSVLSVF